MSTKKLCQSAIACAIVFIVTRFVQIPIPLGYMNPGNAVILLGCLVLPFPGGIVAGAIGSALADLTSFPVYTLPTLLIKAVFPFIFYIITRGSHSRMRHLIGALISLTVSVAGYTLTGMILYGGIATGLTQVPGLIVEGMINLALFMVLRNAVERIDKFI